MLFNRTLLLRAERRHAQGNRRAAARSRRSEVARQTAGDTTATPWLARTDVRATLADQAALTATYADLAAVEEPLLVTDEASIIVAASQPALHLLGYERVDELLGRRMIVVVPARFHQAHIAGTTLHATNGRDNPPRRANIRVRPTGQALAGRACLRAMA